MELNDPQRNHKKLLFGLLNDLLMLFWLIQAYDIKCLRCANVDCKICCGFPQIVHRKRLESDGLSNEIIWLLHFSIMSTISI